MGSIDLHQLRQHGALLSRNRNFELYEHPAARRVLRLHHWLSQLRLDLQRCAESGRVQLRSTSDGEASRDGRRGHVIELEMPALRFRRTVYLDAEELLLLCEDTRIAMILAGGAG
jgi:hypothetical protein